MCNTKSSPCNNLIQPKGLPKSAQSPLLDQPVLCPCCCACMFMAAFSALLQPLFSQPPPLSHCLHHPQHSHHHGQLLQPPKSWPNSPHTLFFSCWATRCFFGHFTRRRLPFNATHELQRPPPTRVSTIKPFLAPSQLHDHVMRGIKAILDLEIL